MTHVRSYRWADVRSSFGDSLQQAADALSGSDRVICIEATAWRIALHDERPSPSRPRVDLDFDAGPVDTEDIVIVGRKGPNHAAHGRIGETSLYRAKDVIERPACAIVRRPRSAACHDSSIEESTGYAADGA